MSVFWKHNSTPPQTDSLISIQCKRVSKIEHHNSGVYSRDGCIRLLGGTNELQTVNGPKKTPHLLYFETSERKY